MILKREYLEKELWILAWNSSVQHASIYKKGAWKSERKKIKKFRNSVIHYVTNTLIPKYKNTVDETTHCENIKSLVNYGNTADTGVLGKFGYKYGIAQKLLNLSLKYYWCLEEVVEPPHCPVDKIVIDKTPLKGKVNWTKIKTQQEYLNVICEVQKLALRENQSIACWELSKYERR